MEKNPDKSPTLTTVPPRVSVIEVTVPPVTAILPRTVAVYAYGLAPAVTAAIAAPAVLAAATGDPLIDIDVVAVRAAALNVHPAFCAVPFPQSTTFAAPRESPVSGSVPSG
jgi:hypothetical protein